MENIDKRNVSVIILHLLYCLHVVRHVVNSGVIWLSYCQFARPHHGVVRLVVRLRPLFGSSSVSLCCTQCMLQRSVNMFGMNVSVVLRVRCTEFSWK